MKAVESYSTFLHAASILMAMKQFARDVLLDHVFTSLSD